MSNDTCDDTCNDTCDDTCGNDSANEAANWRRLRGTTNGELHDAITDDPDIVPTDDAFWENAHLVLSRVKESVTINIDADVLEWFRGEQGFQARINAILRAYMNAQTRAAVDTQ
jgi:uncharacterized protein (DUF4415 family)